MPFTERRCTVELTEERGITIAQLELLFAEIQDRCEREAWTGRRADGAGGWRDEPLTPESVNLYDVMARLILPVTAPHRCSFVELVADHAQPATWFVSHCWSEPVASFIKCLRAHARDRDLPQSASFWVCAYANNQHDLSKEIGQNPQDSSFYRALLRAEGTLAILDQNGEVFERIWCCYETFLALVSGAKLYDAYTVDEDGNAVGLSSGITPIDKRAGMEKNLAAAAKIEREASFPQKLLQRALNFDVAAAKASVESDRISILEAIDDTAELNATVATSYGSSQIGLLLAGDEIAPEFVRFLQRLKASKQRKLLAHVGEMHAPSGACSAKFGAALPPSLVAIELYNVHSAVIAGVCDAICHGALVEVEVASSRLGGADAAALAGALLSSRRVRTLNLPGNPMIGESGARALMPAIALSPSVLRELDLGACALGPSGVELVAEALVECTSLEILKLNGNLCRAEGARAVAGAMASLPLLCELELGGNLLAHEGLSAIARALCHCPQLRKLSLYANLATDRTIKDVLGPALLQHGGICELWLSGNLLSSAGAIALAPALVANARLRSIYLDGNRIRNPGAIALADAFRSHAEIRHVGLSMNYLTSTGCRALGDALADKPSLSTLDVSLNWVWRPRRLRAELAAKLPQTATLDMVCQANSWLALTLVSGTLPASAVVFFALGVLAVMSEHTDVKLNAHTAVWGFFLLAISLSIFSVPAIGIVGMQVCKCRNGNMERISRCAKFLLPVVVYALVVVFCCALPIFSALAGVVLLSLPPGTVVRSGT